MRKQQQLCRHNPGSGVFGDCYRTAIACILDMPAEHVPHFFENGVENDLVSEEDTARVRAWLAERDLSLVAFNLAANGFAHDFGGLMSWWGKVNPGVPTIATVKSWGGDYGHSIVCLDGQVYCDPATGKSHELSRYSPYVDPDAGECWWLEVLAKRLPAT